MHKLQTYENLRDMLEREVSGIEKKGVLDIQSLDNLHKLMASIDSIDECIEREKGGEMSYNSYGRRSYGGGSYDGMSGRMAPWAYDGSYGRGSYEDGMSNARRGRDGDGDGRYNESRESRDNFRYSQNRGGGSYENAYGYSRDSAKKKMVEKLTTLMDDTMSEQERNAIKDCIERIM